MLVCGGIVREVRRRREQRRNNDRGGQERDFEVRLHDAKADVEGCDLVC